MSMKTILTALALAAGLTATAAETAKQEEKKDLSAPAGIVDEVAIGDDSAVAAKAPTVKMLGGGGGIAGSIARRMLGEEPQELVNIASDDALLRDVLRQFRKVTQANIIYSESASNLNQRVSVSFKKVPWLKALESILNTHGFRVEQRDNIYYVREDKMVIPIRTRSFQLNHASASELAELFNKSYGKVDKDGKITHRVATAFDGANVVVVTATDNVISDCENIVRAVDKAVAQIYIEARFIELSNEAMHKLGMQWNQLESWGASVRGLSAGMEYNNGRAANYGMRKTGSQTTFENELTTSSTFDNSRDDQIPYIGSTSGEFKLSNSSKNTQEGKTKESVQDTFSALVPEEIFGAPGAGRSAEDMNWLNARGFSGQLSLDDFRLAMSAFESMSDVKIFSNPKIIVSNGKEANVDMTSKYPNIMVQSARDGQTGALDVSAKMEVIPGERGGLFAGRAFFEWGITLSVKPRISPDGLISVEIIPMISELDTSVTPSGFYEVRGGDGVYGSYPIINVKRLTTDFTMKDGATAVIGGLSKTEEGDVDSGIPYLRKIPWIGPKLFGWKSRGKVQKEIIVFVTVGIADPADMRKDIGLPTNAVRGREYVEGREFEPGMRPDAAKDLLKLDKTPLDERKKEEKVEEIEVKPGAAEGTGTIEIELVKEAEEVKPVAAPKPVEAKPAVVAEVKPVAEVKVEAKPEEVKPEEVKPVEVKPVEAPKPIEAKPVEAPKPVEEAKPVEVKPAEAPKPVEEKAVEAKVEEVKPLVEEKKEEAKPVDFLSELAEQVKKEE